MCSVSTSLIRYFRSFRKLSLISNVHVVLRLSRFGSGFRERVDRVRVFWSAQGGARIAVPRCSRIYIWSAQTRRLSVRVHQNHTLRSTLLTADIISRHQHSDGAHAQRRTQIRSDIRESGTGACGTVSAHTMAHHSSECRVWQPLA